MSYRVILIGYGNMGREWSKVLQQHPEVELVGVVDLLEPNRERAVAELGLAADAVSDDLSKLIETLSPDFVQDCSAPVAHAANARIALEHGCHMIGEKPISLDIKEAERLVELAKSKDKVYMVNQNYRWHPMFRAVKQYLASKPLGAIHTVSINYAQSFPFNDTFRYQMEHVFLYDMAVHHFDLVRSLTGADARTVYCAESNPSGGRFNGGASASAVFAMSDGAVFTYQGAWDDVGKSDSFVGAWRIAGEKGTFTWDGVGNPQVQLTQDGAVTTHDLELLPASAYKPEEVFGDELAAALKDFISAISTGSQPETWCGDNLQTLRMVLGAVESAETDKVVTSQA